MADAVGSLTARIGGLNPSIAPSGPGAPTPTGGPSFKDALSSVNQSTVAPTLTPKAPPSLKFSNHAIDRMRTRGINFSPEKMARIESAVQKAEAKGGKETLLLTDDSALIVNVANKTVVTFMDKNQLKENVFTNIDSTIVL